MSEFDNRRMLGAFREAIVAELTPVVQVKFPYSIHPDIVTTEVTGSGAVTYVDATAELSTGTEKPSSATMISKDVAVYQPGQGMTFRGTAAFATPHGGKKQYIGAGNDEEGYFIGYNGVKFGVMRRHEGVEDWTYLPNVGDGSSEWIGQIDTRKGNVYQIQYQWLGFGNIYFSVFNADHQRFDILHIIKYPNKNLDPSTHNPSFSARCYIENNDHDGSHALITSSLAIFIEGKSTKTTYRKSASGSKTVTTETNILTIKLRDTFHDQPNRAVVFPDLFSLAADGTRVCKFNIYLNATLGGTPSYTNVDINRSAVEYDTAGTTVTGGTRIAQIVVAKDGAQFINLGRTIRLNNGDTLTIAATSASSTIADVSLSWEEMI